MEQSLSGFNWIKALAVPLAAGIMEAQPVTLVIVLVLNLLSPQPGEPFLVEFVTLVCTLGLYWWALFIRLVVRSRKGEHRANLLYALALPVIFVLSIALYAASFDIVALLSCALLQCVYLWRRSMKRVEKSLRGESAMSAFLAAFVVLLLLLFLATTVQQPVYQGLLDLFPLALPLFCLGGLATLSLNRLDDLYTLHRSRFSGKIRTNPIYRWIGTLFLLIVGVAVVGITLNITVFPIMTILFKPLENPVMQFINWLFHVRGRDPSRKYCPCAPAIGIDIPKGPSFTNPFSTLRSVIQTTGLLMLLLLFAAMVVVLVRNILRSRQKAKNTDEVREQLPARPTIQARQSKRRGSLLEGLDVESARARYREFLRAMASKGKGQYRRRLNETPFEYQQRFLPSSQPDIAQSAAPSPAEVPAKEAILATLTNAYTLERYGGQPAPASQRAYLRKWLSLLIKRLAAP